jgi:hypothetical protein
VLHAEQFLNPECGKLNDRMYIFQEGEQVCSCIEEEINTNLHKIEDQFDVKTNLGA